jgi:hypothetical protein
LPVADGLEAPHHLTSSYEPVKQHDVGRKVNTDEFYAAPGMVVRRTGHWVLPTKDSTVFAGHVGAALGIGRAERRINVGAFVFAALLLDFVLWIFVLFGWESLAIPANFAATHQPEFVFPYSHSLLAGIAWSALAGAVVLVWTPRLAEGKWLASTLAAAAVFSHWLLDALVHVPGLPLAGDGSVKAGLGLWQEMTLALAVEGLILLAGLYLYLSSSSLPRARKIWLSVLCLLILAFTVAGMTVAPPPPSAIAMAASSLATIAVVTALVCWLGSLSGSE